MWEDTQTASDTLPYWEALSPRRSQDGGHTSSVCMDIVFSPAIQRLTVRLIDVFILFFVL